MNNIDILEEMIKPIATRTFIFPDGRKEEKEIYNLERKQIEAIENLIAENKELKEEKEKVFNDGYMKGLKHQIIENWNNEHARIIKVKSQFVPISLIEKKIEEYNDILEYAETQEGLAEIKDFEYDEAKYGKKILQELLDERNNTDEH